MGSPIEQRLANIEEMLTKLTDALFAPTKELRKRGLTHHVLIGNPETARLARVSRAAKYYGMTVEQWTELHGERERRLDPGQRPFDSTIPQKPKPKRKRQR